MGESVTLTKVSGVAILRASARHPVPIEADFRGRPCEVDELCEVGPVVGVRLAPSIELAAVAYYRVLHLMEEPERFLTGLGRGAVIHYQALRGELSIIRAPLPAPEADRNGRGELPWRLLAREGADAAELPAGPTGLRELRIRAEALTRIYLGDVGAFRPADHIREILNALGGVTMTE